MQKINAVVTGVGGYVPDYILTNDEIYLVIVATTTPDYRLPSTASILCDKLELKNAFAFDVQAVCSGFLYALETGANFIRSGIYKKVIIVGADKMSSIVDYTDRATCPIFADGAAAFMLEPTTEELGVIEQMAKDCLFYTLKQVDPYVPPPIIRWIVICTISIRKDVRYSNMP